ncbi:MAG: peptidase Ste24p [Acidobacteria bacterium]|nr:peptidase Ste24p [Acidobacteriota bacterium]
MIYDEALNARLQEVGAKLLKQLPPTALRFQFLLYDQPEANAFTLPGGHVYVSRKLVAFVRSEDELAGVLAHEIGHLVTRQTAGDMTRLLKEVLGVTQVGDRTDIFNKYNQLVENTARKPKAFGRSEEDKEQLAADQVAIYTMAAAGYDPHAFSSFWDRFAETKGKTGGWFSDLFGSTKPETRRLRDALKTISSLPPECVTPPNANAEEFQKWQATVINYTGLGRKENLHAVLSKRSLAPPLRGDVNHLRFSPDGKYLLAQDDSGINVLTRTPFAPLFRIDAPEAYPAVFTPDSRMIVSYNRGLRIEMWDVAEAQLKTTHELVIRGGCLQTALSPEGNTLACLDSEFNLALYDVASGDQFFQKKSFYVPNFFEFFMMAIRAALGDEDSYEIVNMAFSQDGHYFVAGQRDAAVSVDLSTRTALSLPGSIKKLLTNPFAFIGSDKLIGTDSSDVKKSGIVGFPGGAVLNELSVGRGHLTPASHGDYLLIRPIKNYPVGVMDLTTRKIFMANKQSAVDIYDDVFVGEQKNSELGLYQLGSGNRLAKVILPQNPLGRLRSMTVSPNLRWLAVSERRRGAVWDLVGGRQHLFRGFRGSYLSDEGVFYADFPKEEAVDRSIAKMDLNTQEVLEQKKIEDDHAVQFGRFLLVTTPNKKQGSLRENVTEEVRDISSGQTLWSRSFPKEAPDVWINAAEETMVLVWAVSANAAKAEIKNDPQLTARLSALKEKEGDYFLQVLDAKSGEAKGKLLIETGKGSFRISSVNAGGDWIVISDSRNRILIYSLSTGEQKGHMFGSSATVARSTGLLAVENEPGKVVVYDLATVAKLDEFVFTSPISLAKFSADGKRLFILTASQTIYLLDVSDLRRAAAAAVVSSQSLRR